MSLDVQNLAILLLHNSIWVAAAAGLTCGLMRWFKLNSHGWQQVAWLLVLLPAACLFNVRYPVSISSPWPNRFDLAHDAQPQSIPPVHLDALSTPSNNQAWLNELDESIESDTASSSRLTDINRQDAWRSDADYVHSFSNSHVRDRTRESSQPVGHLASGSRGLTDEQKEERRESSISGWLSATLSAVTHEDMLAVLSASLVAVWGLGVCVIGSWYLLQIIALQAALRDSVSARSAFQKQWMSLLKACKIDKPIQLVEHASLGPMLTITARGWTVIVPSDFWEELNRPQRLGILRHELAHYQHRDVAWSLLARLLATLQWFNPLAWYALRRFEECAELRCDERILRDGSIRATEYARALVQLIEYPRASPVMARSAGGASLAHRLGKLLGGQTHKDSRGKRLLCALILALMVMSALVRPQFVSEALGQETQTVPSDDTAADTTLPVAAEEATTQDPPATSSAALPERERAVAAMAVKLVPRGDEDREMVRQFKEVVATPAGQVVMANIVQQWEEQLRQQAEAESTLAFVGEMLERSGEKFVLKKEYADFPARFEKACRQFDEDAATVSKMLHEYAARLLSDNEANLLVKRFFLDADAPAQVYVEQVQNRVRPDYRVVREKWDDIFVLDRNNRLVFRSGAKRLAEQKFKRLTRASQMAERLSRAMAQWSKDLSESNPVSKAARAAMSEKSFAAMIAIESINEEYSIEQKSDEYFDYLEKIFIDKADGLVPNDEALAEIEERLKTYASLKVLAAKVQPHLVLMAQQLDDSVPNANAWRELLTSHISILATANEMGAPAADVPSALQNWLEEWLVESEDGKWTVHPEQQEDVINATRERLRSARAFRRRGLDIVEFGRRIDHPGLAAAYQTTAGKSLVLRSLQDRLSRQYFDGLAAWVGENFDTSDDGITLKDGRESVLQEILSEVDRVKQELANDDF